MPGTSVFLRHLRTLIAGRKGEGLTDQYLLTQFIAQRDEAAFAALLERHGPVVLGVCRRTLHDEHLAEDAFQATFLVLARKAGEIRNRQSVGSWLHGVALRLARKAMTEATRGKQPDPRNHSHGAVDPHVKASWHESQEILDDELQRLPENYRLPLVLCYLEGLTRDEAAARLGWTANKLRGFLERGRDRLRTRLIRRGVTLATAASGMLLTDTVLAATVPPLLAISTIHAAARFAAGTSLSACGISGPVVAFTEGGLKMVASKKMTVILALVFFTSVLGSGVGVLAQRTESVEARQSNEPPALAFALEPSKAQEPKEGRVDRFGDPLAAGAVARLGTLRFRLGGLAYQCAYSPDGKLLAAASGDYSVRIFDAATGRPIRDLRHHHMDVISLAFSHDGRLLASGGADSYIDIWDPLEGKLLDTIVTPQRVIWSMAFVREGKALLAAGQDTTLRLWDLATKKELRKFEGHQGPIRSLAVSPDGQMAATGSFDTTIRLWDLATGKTTREFTGHTPRKGETGTNVLAPVAFSPDGKLLASADEQPVISLWEVASGKLVRNLPVRPEIPTYHGNFWTLAFSPDGKALAAGDERHRVRLFEVDTGKLLQERRSKQSSSFNGWHGGGVNCVAFAPGSQTVAVAEESRITLWDSGSGQEVGPSPALSGDIYRVVFSPNDRKLITISEDQTQRVVEWDLVSGRPVRQLQGKVLWAHICALSPDAKVLTATGYDQSLHVWDTMTGKEIRQIPLPVQERVESIQELVSSPDGQLLAGGGNFEDGSIRVWQFATGKEVQKLEGPGKSVWSLAFSPDSKLLASFGSDDKIRLYDLASGKTLRRVDVPAGAGSGLCFSPNGKVLASVGNDRVVRLWDTASGKMIRNFPPLPGQFDFFKRLTRPAFSPDGRMLATSSDRVVRIWELATGQERAAFRGHGGSIQALAFSHDGTTLASGSSDTTAILWDVYGSQGQTEPEAASPPIQRLHALWADLANNDAAKAFRAVQGLLKARQQATAYIKDHLPPAIAPDGPRVAGLIADLDDRRFAVRDKAERELRGLGDLAGPALRTMLTAQPSLDVRRRVEALLERLESDISPYGLQQSRAVEVLEHLGISEARQVLEQLAKGAPEARLTWEARTSLERLLRRTTEGP